MQDARHRRPAWPDQSRGPQTPGHLCGNRPLCNGCNCGGDGVSPGKKRAEVSRLGEGDGGKMAASFRDLGRGADPALGLEAIAGGRAVRIAALESSKQRARELYPQIEGKNAQQMLAYRELPDEELFSTEWVSIPLHAREMPGYKSARIACDVCGEGINYDREVVREDTDGTRTTLCQACAFPESRYYQRL